MSSIIVYCIVWWQKTYDINLVVFLKQGNVKSTRGVNGKQILLLFNPTRGNIARLAYTIHKEEHDPWIRQKFKFTIHTFASYLKGAIEFLVPMSRVNRMVERNKKPNGERSNGIDWNPKGETLTFKLYKSFDLTSFVVPFFLISILPKSIDEPNIHKI